ncbi:MAG TPA: hypothetical protein VH206_19190 [Xanthobacteraceae bacterium]|jgi:hypothetical protein|nr:hypothetical protein [Xanthobacteraceae bacterium]
MPRPAKIGVMGRPAFRTEHVDGRIIVVPAAAPDPRALAEGKDDKRAKTDQHREPD